MSGAVQRLMRSALRWRAYKQRLCQAARRATPMRRPRVVGGGTPPRRWAGLRSWTHIATSHILALIVGFWVRIFSRAGKRVSWVHDVEFWPDVDGLACDLGNGDEHFFQS